MTQNYTININYKGDTDIRATTEFPLKSHRIRVNRFHKELIGDKEIERPHTLILLIIFNENEISTVIRKKLYGMSTLDRSAKGRLQGYIKAMVVKAIRDGLL